MRRLNNDPFRVVHHFKDFEFELQEGVVLRKMFLPMEFDDIGNAKTYTEAEKKELRGDDKTKPGYIAKVDELSNGAEAKLYLVAPKKKDADAKDKDKDDDGVGNVERSTVKMVVLTKESTAPVISGADPKKKDKK